MPVIRVLITAVAWAAATALTVFIAIHTEFGPVVVPLFEVDGVHMGDVAAGVACAVVALAATAAIWLPVRNDARR